MRIVCARAPRVSCTAQKSLKMANILKGSDLAAFLQVLVHHQFLESTDKELTVRSQLMDDEGTVLVTMNEMRFREVRAGIDCGLSSVCFSFIFFLQILHLQKRQMPETFNYGNTKKLRENITCW